MFIISSFQTCSQIATRRSMSSVNGPRRNREQILTFLIRCFFSIKITFFLTLYEVFNKIIPIVERNTYLIYGDLSQRHQRQIEPSLLEFYSFAVLNDYPHDLKFSQCDTYGTLILSCPILKYLLQLVYTMHILIYISQQSDDALFGKN